MDDADASGPLGRADIGETRAIVVDRGGQETTLELTFGPQLGSDALDDYVGLLMGLTILVAGLWAYVRSPSAGTRLLAVLGCLCWPRLPRGSVRRPRRPEQCGRAGRRGRRRDGLRRSPRFRSSSWESGWI